MEIPADTQARMNMAKAFLAEMGLKSTPEIVAAFERTKSDYLAEIDGLSASQLEFKPAPDRWSIREVSLHISQVMRGVGGLMMLLGSGGAPPPGAKAEPGTLDPDPGDWEKIRQMVVEGFDSAMNAAKSLDGMKAPDAKFPHPWFGELNIRGWAAFNILHGNVHVNQVRKNKAADGYPR